MRVIIAGSRHLFVENDVFAHLVRRLPEQPTEVITGGANGIDFWANIWARVKKIPTKVYKPDWTQGKKAGPLRNEEMARNADALILIWDGKSRGSADMKRRAEAHKLFIVEEVVRIK